MSGRSVLVVDDEAPVRTLLRGAIGGAGFTVYDADGGQKALDIAAQRGPFSIVVTDVLMPGMDGVELAQHLAADGRSRAFLFISGYCDLDEMSLRLQEFGSAAFLSKPFSIRELLSAIERLLAAVDAPPHTAPARGC